MMYQGPIRFAAVDEFGRKAVPDWQPPVEWQIVTATLGPDGKLRYVKVPITPDVYEADPRAFACVMENALYSLQYLLDNPDLDTLD